MIADKVRRLGWWILAIWLTLTVIGLAIYVGSIHSGGTSLYVAAALVPPLYLDIKGFLRIDNFAVWLLVVAGLQLVFCGVVVSAIAAVRSALRPSSGN